MLQVFINILLTLHVFVSLLLLLVVLMQRPKSEGLGAAFGGGMTENIFGAQTTHVLSRLTVWLGGIFFAFTLLLAILYAKQSDSVSLLQQELKKSEPVAIQSAKSTESTENTADAGTTDTIVAEETTPAAKELSEISEPAKPVATGTEEATTETAAPAAESTPAQ